MICFLNCDRRWPFLWEGADQPAARWHGVGHGPVQYLADTPNAAWAEFLRHEEITEDVDVAGVSRALWAVEIEIDDPASPQIPAAVMTGDVSSYDGCQREAARLRRLGVRALRAPSAALHSHGATGYRVETGFQHGPERDGVVFVCFGRRPEAVGWAVVNEGRPPVELLGRVRHL